MARLTFKNESSAAHPLELRPGVNRLGRREDNDFLIEDPTVSSIHCEIWVDGDSAVVRDLGSSNGTFIDGQQIREEMLNAGQTLRLGDIQLVFEPSADISVSIPKWEELRGEAPPVTMPDGCVACTNHGDVPATQQCTHCKRVFCNGCVHHLRRAGGKFLDLCPVCSHRCELLPGIKSGKRSFLARLQDKLGFSSKD